MRVLCAIGLASLFVGACDQTQEDRAAKQAASVIHEGNQALRDLSGKTREAAEQVGDAARKSARRIGASASDAVITGKVKAALGADRNVDAGCIDVDTRDAVVTLTGKLDRSEQADRAVDIARNVEGVKEVRSNLGKG